MTQKELIEQLADKEHASWANWMKYLFDISNENPSGSVTISPDYVERWKRQVKTEYKDLSEREKQSDRDEVSHILPIINQHVSEELEDVLKHGYGSGNWRRVIQMKRARIA